MITGFYNDAMHTARGFVVDASGKITSFDATNSTFTIATARNASGQITGRFYDNATHGYGGLLRNVGHLHDVDAGGVQTLPAAINDPGKTAGYWLDATGVITAFVRTPSGVIYNKFLKLKLGSNQPQRRGMTAGWAFVKTQGVVDGYIGFYASGGELRTFQDAECR